MQAQAAGECDRQNKGGKAQFIEMLYKTKSLMFKKKVTHIKSPTHLVVQRPGSCDGRLRGVRMGGCEGRRDGRNV